MPTSAPGLCSHPGCGALAHGRFCSRHLRTERAELDRARGSAASRGYDARWRRASKAFLREHPLCVYCQAEGKVVASAVTDHIVPHRGDAGLFWDRTNWQALCKPCHDGKKQREERAAGVGGANL